MRALPSLIDTRRVFFRSERSAQWHQGISFVSDCERCFHSFSFVSVVKLNAWELAFIGRISDVRKKELAVIHRRALMTVVSTSFYAFAPVMLAMMTFATYAFTSAGHELTAKKAFVSLAIFNLFRTPLTFLPFIIGSIMEVRRRREKRFRCDLFS